MGCRRSSDAITFLSATPMDPRDQNSPPIIGNHQEYHLPCCVQLDYAGFRII